MRETETKFEVKNLRDVAAKIKKLGGRLEWKGIEENYFFDTSQGALKKKKINFRLRRWSNHSNTLTLKTISKKDGRKYKIRNEYQIEFNYASEMRKILASLGFLEYFRYKKYREHWKLENFSLELDKIKNKSFVEIEAPQKKINKFAKLLGLDWGNSTTESYISIYRKLSAQ